MRKRAVYVILGVLVVGGVFVVVFAGREREPEYGGKRLSEWVEMLILVARDPDGPAPPAEDAIHHIGTNAVPYLLKWIRYESPAWKARFYAVLGAKFTTREGGPRFYDRSALRAGGAAGAFGLLGNQPEATIAELCRIAKDPRGSERVLNAAGALACLSPPNKWAAVPALVQLLKAKDTHRAFEAAWLLGDLDLDASRIPAVLPALTKIFQHSDPRMRRVAARAVGTFGENARAAVPALLSLLSDPDVDVRYVATNALIKIDPTALERGGR